MISSTGYNGVNTTSFTEASFSTLNLSSQPSPHACAQPFFPHAVSTIAAGLRYIAEEHRCRQEHSNNSTVPQQVFLCQIIRFFIYFHL